MGSRPDTTQHITSDLHSMCLGQLGMQQVGIKTHKCVFLWVSVSHSHGWPNIKGVTKIPALGVQHSNAQSCYEKKFHMRCWTVVGQQKRTIIITLGFECLFAS